MHLVIIANPESGNGKAIKNAQTLGDHIKQEGMEVSIHQTLCRGDGERLAKIAVEKGASHIIACGGDGTVNEVINGIKSAATKYNEPILALLPSGRCNNFWKELNAPSDPKHLSNLLSSGQSKKVDLGTINGRYFATVAALGFDSAVAEFVDDKRGPTFLKGTASYLYALIATLPKFKFPMVSISGDIDSFRGEVLLVAIGNTASYGGNFIITPSAKPDDGLLDVCIVRKTSKFEILKVLPKVFSGKHVTHPSVSIENIKSVTVDSKIPIWIWADGEKIMTVPATIRVESSAIDVAQ
jgi:YegS/Rv2252/BmrU family lipid kinase